MISFKDVFKEKDNEIDLENADKMVNQNGIMGAIIRGALGKDGLAEVNDAIQSGHQAQAIAQQVQQNAAAAATAAVVATASVLNITGGNTFIMGNPLVALTLQVAQEGKEPFAMVMETVIPSVQMPRIGDTVNLGENPNNPAEFLYLGIRVG